MCKTLFRFEDKYGMHSIVTSLKVLQKTRVQTSITLEISIYNTDYRVYRAYVQRIS